MFITCSRCGEEFDLACAKRRIGRLYGVGTYEDYYPDANTCDSCAIMEISADVGTGQEDLENSGFWDD